MYPPSSSSSSQKPMNSSGLTRYVSAPGSLLTNAVDSIIGTSREFSPLVGQYVSGHSSDSNCRVNNNNSPADAKQRGNLQRSYGFSEMPVAQFSNSGSLKTGSGGDSSSALLRQKSSPAGFLAQLTPDNGLSMTRCSGSYNAQSCSGGSHGVTRLNSQLSFTRQDSLSHISGVSENAVDSVHSDSSRQTAARPYMSTSFAMDTWENGNSIVFSAPQGKRAKIIDDDILNCLNTLDSQFSLPQTSLEMGTMERLLNIPEDSVPCKIRAKRGFATHPRSIAERERRTRISGKLKKLQELVPNMDKQTSYADMLDLAVQHIKGLQSEVQKLQKEVENCKCGCKPNT